MSNMKYAVYLKEKTEKDWCWQTFHTRDRREISHAFSVLSPVHNIRVSWLSL